MHDFCFTIPYGLILLCGGVFGFARKGSIASLVGGVATGLLLIRVAYLSLRAYQKRRTSYVALFLETAIAALLSWIMGQRYMNSGKIMPAGMIAGISVIMTVFYLYKVVTGGNRIPPKRYAE